MKKTTTESHHSRKQKSVSTSEVEAEVNNVPLLGKLHQEDSLVFLTHANSISLKLLPRSTSLLVLDMDETLLHSGFGNSYCPDLILRFIPGEIGCPCVE